MNKVHDKRKMWILIERDSGGKRNVMSQIVALCQDLSKLEVGKQLTIQHGIKMLECYMDLKARTTCRHL